MHSSDTSETIKLRYPYESITFPVDKDTQRLNLETSSNLWYEFTFAPNPQSPSPIPNTL